MSVQKVLSENIVEGRKIIEKAKGMGGINLHVIAERHMHTTAEY